MDALVRATPQPGSAEPGDIYVELQSRTLWVGVDPAVDPSGFVLISDILALEAEIAGSLVEAKAYTDTRVATRAPLAHTHTAAQITDFNAAVDAALADNLEINWVTGMIMLWSGSIAEIGVGALAGWALCDGGNGTPDLRDRFIIGAGNRLPWTKNEPAAFLTDVQGWHAHVLTTDALTEAQMPYHAHYGEIHSRQYGATYGGAGAHQHYIGAGFNGSGISSNGGYIHQTNDNNGAITGVAGAHDHSCFVDIHVGMGTDARGGNQGHTHGCYGEGSHQHTVTPAQVREASPYFALAYIMKL